MEKQDIINDLVDIIINTRDLCGNEKEAAIDHLADEYKIKGQEAKELYAKANFQANNKWNNLKKEAGVKPKYTF